MKVFIPASHFLLSALYADAERHIFRSHAARKNEEQRENEEYLIKNLPISVPLCLCGVNVSC